MKSTFHGSLSRKELRIESKLLLNSEYFMTVENVLNNFSFYWNWMAKCDKIMGDTTPYINEKQSSPTWILRNKSFSEKWKSCFSAFHWFQRKCETFFKRQKLILLQLFMKFAGKKRELQKTSAISLSIKNAKLIQTKKFFYCFCKSFMKKVFIYRFRFLTNDVSSMFSLRWLVFTFYYYFPSIISKSDSWILYFSDCRTAIAFTKM